MGQSFGRAGWGILALLLVCGVQAQTSTEDRNEAALRNIHLLAEKANQERVKHGLAPLKLHDGLIRASVAHARDMAKFGYFGHCTPNAPADTEDFDTYARQQRYPGQTGENLYHGEPKAAQVITDWMNSPEHRSNLLDPRYNEIGTGYARGRDFYDTYCVMFFGKNTDAVTVVINNEAYSTVDTHVQLYLSAPDAVKQMRFSEDGRTFCPWEPAKKQRDLTLSGTFGKRTVYAEWTDGERTYRANDTIILTRPDPAPSNP